MSTPKQVLNFAHEEERRVYQMIQEHFVTLQHAENPQKSYAGRKAAQKQIVEELLDF